MVWDILLVVLAGAFAIGISVRSIISTNEKDKKLDSVNKLNDANQKKLKEQTETIAALQKQIIEKSDLQILSLKRVSNPIPQSMDFTFSFLLELSDIEKEQVWEVINPLIKTHGNLLPIDTQISNGGIEKINLFKNIHLRINIKFQKDGKEMTISLNRGPMDLFGYNTQISSNTYTLYIDNTNHNVKLDGLFLTANEISTNYRGPSLLDFENSNVEISYEFAYPTILNVSGKPMNRYVFSHPEILSLELKSIIFYIKQQHYEISNLSRIDSNKFAGKWIVND